MSVIYSFGIGIFIAFLVFTICYFWQKLKLNRTANIVFPIVLASVLSGMSMIVALILLFTFGIEPGSDKQTLKAADFGIIDQRDDDFYLSKSIFASEETYYIDNNDETVFEYTIFRSDFKWILSKYAQEQYNSSYDVDIPDWDAKRVIQSELSDETIVIYDNIILLFKNDISLNSEQINNIKIKLHR